MNRDGQIDLVVAEGGAEPSLWMVTAREGGGSFLRKELLQPAQSRDLIAADGDGDGVPEVMIQDEDRNIYILEGELEDDDWDDWQARWTTWSVDLVSPVKLVDLEEMASQSSSWCGYERTAPASASSILRRRRESRP